MIDLKEIRDLAASYYYRYVEDEITSNAEQGQYKTTLCFPIYEGNGSPTHIELNLKPVLDDLRNRGFTVKDTVIDCEYFVSINWETEEEQLFNDDDNS